MKANKQTIEELQKIDVDIRNLALSTDIKDENIFKQLSENIDDVFWLRSGKEMLYISPAFEKIWGVPCSEVFKNPQIFADSIHPDDQEKVLSVLNSMNFKKTSNFDYEYRIIRPDKEVRWICAKSLPVIDNKGEIIRRVGIARDITQKKTSQEEKNLLAEMLDIAPNSITIHDNQGNFLYANQKTFELHGYSSEEFMAINLHKLDVPESSEKIAERIKAIQESGNAKFEVEHFKKDGSKIPLEVFVRLVDWMGSQAMLSIATDISERKKFLSELSQAQKVTNQSLQFYKGTFEKAAVGIAHILPNGCFIKVNNKFCEITGYSTQELIGKSYKDITPPEDIEKENLFIQKVYSKEIDSFIVEKRYFHKKGHIIWVLLCSNVVRDSEDNIEFAICTISDITDRIIIQEDLITSKEKAEKANRLKTEFLNNMSHEIRTPMNGIIGFSELLVEPGLSEEKRAYYAKIVQNSSLQLLHIIDDILEISILETKQNILKEEPFYLNDLLMELFSIFNLKSKERNIPLYIKKGFNDAESRVVSDKTKLSKILSNLLENALKYTNEGHIEMGYYVKANNLVLYVKDTGIGISPQNHEIIFERFSQEEKEISQSRGGLGLGLSISKESAKLLGGDITLESEKGRGSTFYVTIPFKAARDIFNNRLDSSLKPTTTSKRSYTVLIAEDEEVNYLFLEALFKREKRINFNIIHSKTGREAVDICTGDNNIDLVLMDLKMPKMSGLEATQHIKYARPNLPIIAQTAYSTCEEKELALKYGCDDFISKPINKERLFELINKYLKVSP